MTKKITNIAQFKPLPKSRGKIGVYLWLDTNKLASSASSTNCPLSIDIFAEPCTIVGDAFNCNSTGGSTIDAGQTDLANLAVGDEFTTSDYTIVVTEASKTGTTFSGKGKLIFNFLKISNTLALQIPISVTFTGIKINQCYQLYNGSVITEYDPSWGSVVSADQIKNQLSGVYTQIKDLMDNVSENAALLQQKIKDLRAARADLVNAEFTAEYKAEQLAALDAAISGMVCLVGEPPISGGRLSLFFNTNSCDVASVKLAINNASNIIENPTTNSEIDSDGLNVKYVNAINKGETVYTCNCGWFDTNHAFKVSGGADQRIGLDNLWKNIQRDFGQKSLMPGSNGYKLTYRQEAKSIGITKSYYIPYGLTLNVKKQIALAILRDVSVAFEALQIGGILLGDGSSSFEVSDLVSNQVGLYARFNNQDKDTILQNCGKLTPAESLAIYKLYPTIWDQFNFTYRNTTFNPIFFSNTYCTNPVFPYNNIEPLNPSGSFSNTFRYWNDFD
jgi:hypothetical protein